MAVKGDLYDVGDLSAPLSGQIIDIRVKEGDEVAVGQEIMVLSAMKMENVISSERQGRVSKILVSVSDNVSSGQALIEFE